MGRSTNLRSDFRQCKKTKWECSCSSIIDSETEEERQDKLKKDTHSIMRKSLSRRFALSRSLVRRKTKDIVENSSTTDEEETKSAEPWKYNGVSLEWLSSLREKIKRSSRQLVVFEDDFADLSKGATACKVASESGDDILKVTPRSDAKSNKKEICVPSSFVRTKSAEEWEMQDVLEYLVQTSLLVRKGQASFADSVIRTKDPRAIGREFRGVFLIAPRNARFDGVLQAIEHMFRGFDTSRIFVWTEVLCGNHAEGTDNSSAFQYHLEAVPQFDYVCSYVGSWLEPCLLTNVSCIAELFSAVLVGKDITALYETGADEDFSDALMTDNRDAILEHIVDFDVDALERRNDQDEALFKQLRKATGGLVKVNYRITFKIRQWIEETVQRCVKESEQAFSATVHAEMLSQSGLLLKDNGQFDLAKEFLTEALEERETLFGPDHVFVADSLANLSSLLHHMGETTEAASLQQQADATKARARAQMEAHGEDQDVSSKVDQLCKTAHALQQEGDHNEAIKVYRRALGIMKQDMDSNFDRAGIVLFQIGRLLESTNDLDAAEKNYRCVLGLTSPADQRKVHPLSATILSRLGGIQMTRSEFTAALKSFRHALRLDMRDFGEMHPTVAQDLANIAQAYEALGQLEKAKKSMAKAVSISFKASGASHPTTISLKQKFAKMASNITV